MEELINIGDFAKQLNIKGFGRNSLFKFLKDQGIIDARNIPYQRYMDAGYFGLIKQRYSISLGDSGKMDKVSHKPVLTVSGCRYIANKLIEKGILKDEKSRSDSEFRSIL